MGSQTPDECTPGIPARSLERRMLPFCLTLFTTFCALTVCLWDTQAGFYCLCAIAWISFFACALGKDYSGGLYISQTAPIFIAVLTVILCMPGQQGDLGRAILLGIIPVYAGCAMWEFFRRLKSRAPLGIFRGAH